MLLVVAMVLTMAPLTATAAYDKSNIVAPEVSGVTWSQPTISELSFSVDTTATTEVIRVAAGENSFSLGILNDSTAPYTIVEATESGVPANTGTFNAIAYARETPVRPTVVFTITGDTPDEVPGIVSNITGIGFGATQTTTSGNSTTYTFPVQGSGGDIAPHKDVIFTITFYIDSVKYTTYAYSHIENILVMNGWVSYLKVDNTSGANRISAIGQFQSHNMYSRMNGADWYKDGVAQTDTATAVDNVNVGYINYASGSPIDGNALLGCGNDPQELSTAINAYGSAAPNDSIAGNEQKALIKGHQENDGDYYNMCIADDTNRAEPIIYMDATDTLESLNFRFTLQNAELKDFVKLHLKGFTFWNSDTVGSVGSQDTSLPSGTNVDSSVLAVKSGNTGTISDTSGYSTYLTTYFTGNGPRTDTSMTDPYVIWTNIGGEGDGRTTNGYNGMGLVFKCYDTRDLRIMYEGALAGDGSTQTCVTSSFYGTPITFNKGVFPRESMYKDAITAKVQAGEVLPSSAATGGTETYSGDEYARFAAALKVAGSVLAEPDTYQSKIDAAAVELYYAYMDLPTPSETVDVYIRLCDNTTKQPLVRDGKELIMTIPDVPINSTIDVNAASVGGYQVTGDATAKIEVTGAVAEITEDFYYNPMNYTIMYYYNNSVPSIDDPAEMTDSDKLIKSYNSTIDLDAVNVGTIDHYTFAGWYLEDYTDAEKYADTFNSISKVNDGTTAVDHTVTANEDFYAIWKITPLNVNATPVTNTGIELTANKKTVGTVQLTSEDDVKQVAKPADFAVDGYLFGGYYENYDASTNTFSNPVSWPVSFAFGDSDKEIYARMVDVNGRISFNSNGGSDVPDVEFVATDAAPATVSPSGVPTKKGYTFKGWFNEDGSRQYFANGTEANGWTDGTETLTNMTGFLAYAEWEPNQVFIEFDLGTPSTAFDTSEVAMIDGRAEQPIPEGEIPPDPVRFGKTFAQWVIQGTSTVFDFTTYPLENIVLEPVWNDTKYSAFISLGASEKLSGEYVDIVKPEASGDERTGKAQKGDIVTFRMTSQTNFFTGSSVFVFMYDKNFYELVGSGSDAFILNENNEYVAGIDAQHIGVTNSDLFVTNGKWPDGISSDTYNAMMVTIDPTVTSNNYNCEPMSDGTWLIEFQLKVKDTASGSGVVYMDNKWTRTADNIMGTMFYGWAETKDTSVADTTNNVVEPNLDKAIVTLEIDETPQVEVEITVNPNGGAWEDGSTDAKTFKGNAETEILDYVSPSRDGYEFKVSNGKNLWTEDAEGTSANTWAEGYYGKEDQEGDTFYAQWQAIEYDVKYYVDEDGELWDEEKLAYESPIDGPMYDITNAKEGYDFAYWYYLDDNGNEVEVTLGTTPVPLGGVDLYAKWTPGEVNVTVVVNYFNNQTQKDATLSRTIKAITGKNLYVVETEGTDPNGHYVLYSSLPAVNGYEFDTSNAANQALATTPTVVAADGTTTINVYYKAKTITYTFDANGGVYANNSTTQTIEGDFYTETAEKVATLETPVRDGYDFKGWHATKSVADQGTAGTVRANFTVDTTYYAAWSPMSRTVLFNANGGTFADNATETSVSSTYGSAITTPTAPTRDGYDFLGWNTSSTATDKLDDLGTMDSTVNNEKVFYAVWKIRSHDVTYTVDGVLDDTLSENVEYGSTVTVAAEPADITGYTFNGWYYNNTKYTAGSTLTMPDSAVVFEGTFDADTFDVKFDANGGAWSDDSTLKTIPTEFDTTIDTSTVGLNAADPNAPTRQGYEFLGWAESEESNTTVNPGTLTAEGKTYYAVWKATIWTYSIEFYEMDTEGVYQKLDDATINNSGTVASTVDYEVPAKTGFTVDTAMSTNYDASTNKVSGTVTVDPALVLKVYYSRNKHTLTWVENLNNTTVKTEELYFGEAIAAPDYSADGYDVALDTTDTTMPDKDLTITFVHTAKKYDVIFNAGQGLVDGASTKTINASYNSTLQSVYNNIITVEREGYALTGWSYTDGGAVIDLTTEKVPVNGTTLYAVWAIQSYAVNFRAGNGTFAENGTNTYTTTVTYGDTIPTPANPTRTGWAFTAWSPAVPATMPAGIQNFTAQWTQETYNVIFNIDGTEIPESYKYGDTIVVPDETQTVKTGYTFQYWTDVDPSTVEDAPAEVDIPDTMADIGNTGATVTYYAYFKVDSHNVTWLNEDGSTFEGPTSYEYEALITLPATNPTKTGWTFKGWKAADGTLYTASVPAMGTADVSYTAYFEIDSHNVTWLNEDGSTFEGPTSYNYQAEIKLPATNPTKTGWTFKGWKAADGTLYTTAVPVMGTADVSYTAYFEIDSHSVTWYDEDGTTVLEGPTSYNYQAEISLPATNPTKTGWSFKGWKAADDTLYTTAVPVMGTADVSYKAYYEINTYTVTWDYNGDDANTADKVDTIVYGQPVAKPSNPIKTGYNFLGWMGSDGILYAVGQDVPAMGAGNVTYTAEWGIQSYTVTWLNEDGKTTFDSGVYDYMEAVSKPATNPTKTGWTFTGWKAADGTVYGENEEVPAMGTANVSYTAYFVINQYVIVFDAADGAWAEDADADGSKTTYTIKQNYNSMATKPGNPSREGYTFEGWSTTKGGAVVDVPATWYVAAENVNYYAVWTINQYTVKFLNAEGETHFTVSLDYGTVIQSPEAYAGYTADPTLEYYTFEGWSLTEVALGQFEGDVAPSVIDFATANITVPENGITIYPAFARVVVTLAAIAHDDGTAAVIETVENTEDPIEGYITGLQTKLSKAKLLSTYLTVEGDGRLEVTTTKYKVCGTGAKVDVYDRMGTPDDTSDDKLVETYTIIIYGDVNGDSAIDATDSSMIGSEVSGLTAWSDEESEAYEYCMVVAADLDGNGFVESIDADMVDSVTLMVASVDQQTGKVTSKI